jgi:hypothetical protein
MEWTLNCMQINALVSTAQVLVADDRYASFKTRDFTHTHILMSN